MFTVHTRSLQGGQKPVLKRFFPNFQASWKLIFKLIAPAVLLGLLIFYRDLFFGPPAITGIKAVVPLQDHRAAVYVVLILLIVLSTLDSFRVSFGKNAGAERLHVLRGPVPALACLGLVIANAALSFLEIELINNYYILNMKFRYVLLGIGITLVLDLAAVLLLNSLTAGMVIGNIFFLVWGITNYFVQQFRGIPFQWIDFGSMGTAMSVSGNYKYEPNWQMVACVVVTTVVCCFYLHARTRKVFDVQAGRIGSRIAGAALLIAFYTVIFRTGFLAGTGIWLRDWQPWYTYRLFGMESGFLAFAKASFPQQPEGYSKGTLDTIMRNSMEEAEKNPLPSGADIPENIVVIMNESFSDLTVYPHFAASEDLMPNIRSLSENTQKGKLLVSVKGGTTANTEYEFLTGNSCVLSPTTVVYNSFIKQDQFSLARTLKSQGYEVVAMHPYGPNGWNRNVVYPRMGFDTFLHVKNAFQNAQNVRSFISDESDYREIERLIDEKEKGQKLFIFNITMQNHSQYKQENFQSTVDVVGFEGKNEGQAEQYCTLLKLSDEAIMKFLDYCRGLDEKTLVLFFGDHQPEIGDDFWEYCSGTEVEDWNFEEQQRAFETCYFFWANYDIPEKEGEMLSANYLSSYLLSLTGLEKTGYNNYLLQLQGDYPALNSFGYLGQDGRQHRWDTENTDPVAAEQLRQYKCLIYNELTGGASREESFFGLPDRAG